ncbi:glyoxylase-like metal-dependent hydrolase (beta-lactamase superfamily II) [Pelomonas saccharophila]|uniref:Glyoxylase-like metal-dependent hydrolase (Beta-lactamase superfamily II) n=1 Tax=Roseateles saccharophilus TaxID=304 RepID=A0ABU1YKK0_ROSSA|nr:MBL fold metallo-hydrolase [Roseateles saccharophilus]MDR7268716.1 glyoxylase-like metal-dependent hydrolase (beta-lactamase superfamily II) [Roseateles saccharophilus]
MNSTAPFPTPSRRRPVTLGRLAVAAALALSGLAAATLPAPAQAAAPQFKTQAPGWYRLMVGSFEVTSLSDGTVGLAVDQILHAPAGRVAQGLKQNFQQTPLETSVNAWLINTGSRLVLVDAGAGTLFGPTLGKLVTQIRAAGYQPEQVDDILITHMHPDHVGGLAADGQRVFANATVHADKADADYWLSPAKADAAPKEVKGFFQGAMASLTPYVQAGRFAPFERDGEIVPGIRALQAHGHTAGHAVYAVESQGQRLVLIGDLIHVASVQLASPEVTIAFDADEPQAAKTRARVFAELAKEGSLVAITHFSFPGVGRLRQAGKGWQWLPLDYSSQLR